jgi:4-amino-4-deoxy-L-arabinose transferase-like glycosyltransferase
LARVYLAQRETPGAATKTSLALLFWTAIAVGTLVKGPIIWLFAGLPAVVLSIADRNARWLLALRPLVGLAWCALIALPWFIAIVSQSGFRFLSESIVSDLLSRTVTGKDGNWRPPGFHFLLFWIMFWPGAPLAAVAAPQLWQMRGAADVRLLLAWIIPAWIVFEIALTKQPHYVLPLFPAIAIAIAVAIERRTLSPSRWLQNATIGWFLLPLGVFIASVIFIAYAGRSVGYLSWPIAAFATTIGAFAWWLYTNREIEQALLKAIAAALLVSIAFHGLVLPALAYVSPSPEIARYLRDAPCSQPRLASAGYQEPSLVFLAGTQTVLTDGRGAAEFLRDGGCRYVAVESRQLRNFTQYAENAGIRYEAVGRVERFNLARVRRATILVFRAPMGDRAP